MSDETLVKILAEAPRNSEGHPVIHAPSFVGSSFTNDASFEAVEITGEADWTGATFLGNALFRSCIFRDNVVFDGTVFAGLADFAGCQFESGGSFEGTRFLDVARFTGSSALRELSFLAANFMSQALFDGPDIEQMVQGRWLTFHVAPQPISLLGRFENSTLLGSEGSS